MDSMTLFIASLAVSCIGALASVLLIKADNAAKTAGCLIGAVAAVLSFIAGLEAVLGDVSSLNTVFFFPFARLELLLNGLAGLIVVLISILAFAGFIYGLSYFDEYPGKVGRAGFFMNTFVASMMLVITADNVFWFLVAFELMSLTSYFLVVIEENKNSIRGGWLYFVIAHVGFVLIMASFLLMTNGVGGSFSFSDFRTHDFGPAVSSACFVLAFFGFGAKAGIIPLHSWLPQAHPEAPSNVSALMSGGMIKIAEAFHERKFAEVADAIQEAHRTRGVRMVLISGPSSSGKTTSAKRLGLQLGVLGLRPVMISLDDYFVEREKTPRDENGQYDYEALEAIDLELFNDHLHRLLLGQSVDIPRYDFITGRRTQHDTPLTLDERSILIIEGIHGLNPRLTPSVPDAVKFKIYISCFTSVAMDNLSRIATTDNRLLRRLTRDYRQRGADALQTLSRWASVRRGEERHIFPYQENADVMFNSSLFYEISALRPFAEKILREVPDTVPEFDEARRMLKFLDNFIPIPSDEIPPTSILREFIGGSSFKY